MKNLHRTLMTEAKQDNINLNVLPPDPTRLGRELNIIEGNLPSLGYTMRKKDTNRGVKVIFSKLKNTTLDSQLEEKPESYSNIWKVSDLRDLLKPSVDEGGQDSPDPVKSSEQVNEKLTELKHSLRELGKPVSAQEVYEAYKDILELDSESEVEKMLEYLRSSDEVALVGLNRYKYLEEKIPGRLNDDIKKLIAYLEARKEEALTIEEIAKNLNWSLEKTRKILEVTDRDGATYQPRPGYWRLD